MDDIDKFLTTNKKALKAAEAYSKRANRGLPSDRWTDGIDGAHLVADGISAQIRLLALYDATTKAIWADLRDHQKRAQEGMGIIKE